ncbi:MAG TPA: methionine synthase [Streptosporangiaceae bacterium]|nr:methionine synthase [Streptosporangiaceae bacterium]
MNADERSVTWPAGSATGVGSMPGTDPREAMAVIVGELPDFPHLAELPARGPGADIIGRTASLLIDLPVQTTARGWRLAARPGRDLSRAAGMLSADLDAMEEAAEGFDGTFKIQVCGPWTLAASLELSRSMEPALADEGAVADLVGSLAEGLSAHVAAVKRRLPDAAICVQVDEPALPGVLAGAVPTASGLHRLSAVEASVASDNLRIVLDAAAEPALVHCCAQQIPFACITGAGATAVSFDLSLLRRTDEDAFGEAAEAGLGMFAGVVHPLPRVPARQSAAAVIDLWLRIGLPAGRLAEQVVITPACGLAGASPADARTALGQCVAAAKLIPELIEEGFR